jgi:hypothetical protein
MMQHGWLKALQTKGCKADKQIQYPLVRPLHHGYSHVTLSSSLTPLWAWSIPVRYATAEAPGYP